MISDDFEHAYDLYGGSSTRKEVEKYQNLKKQIDENEIKAKKYDEITSWYNGLIKENKSLRLNQHTQTDSDNQRIVDGVRKYIQSLKDSRKRITMNYNIEYGLVVRELQKLLGDK